MELKTFTYSAGGWSVANFPQLDSESTLVVVFGSSTFFDHPGPVQQLVSSYPKSHIVGCSTSGEIAGDKLVDGSLSVAVAKFNATELASASAPVAQAADSCDAGKKLANELFRDDLKGVFVLSDGLHVNGSELVRGFNETLPASVIVTGGLAGDGADFQRTWVIKDGMPATGWVGAIGFYGDKVLIGHGSKGGWDKFGPERKITKSEGNVLFELDGKPALELYKEYLGDKASGLPASGLLFPLAIRTSEKDEKSLVRTILAVDEDAQSMTFAGDIPEGSLAQLMFANFDRLIDGALTAATDAASTGGGDSLAIAISCVGRRLVLSERAEEEIEAALEALPQGTQLVGFYSYGEISPYASGNCDLHNQTMTLTTLAEAA